MRKATMILLMVLILTLGGTCFAAAKLYDSRDEVTLTEMSVWGNKESMQDLTMQMHMMQMRMHIINKQWILIIQFLMHILMLASIL